MAVSTMNPDRSKERRAEDEQEKHARFRIRINKGSKSDLRSDRLVVFSRTYSWFSQNARFIRHR